MADPILASEILFYKPRTVTNDGTNGGRISNNLILNNTEQNTFPHAFSAEREIGSTVYRKIATMVSNALNKTLYQNLFRFFEPTAGDDYCCFFEGTESDTQADIVGTERKFGVLTLKTAVAAGAQTLVLEAQDVSHVSGNDVIIAAGDPVFITDKLTYDAVSGNIEQKAVGTIGSIVGTTVTITLDATLTNGYAAWDPVTRTGTKV